MPHPTESREALGYRIATTVLVILIGASGLVYGLVTDFGMLALIGGFVMAGGVVAFVVVLSISPGAAVDGGVSAERGRMPSLARLRRRFFGERTPYTDSLTSTLASANRGGVGVGMLVPPPGPFDSPPPEPIVLDPAALPWELRDEDERPG